MQDRRRLILDTALAILREHGLAGFTQPRIAARAKIRQSHLTYYFPTRLDLLSAAADAAADSLLDELDQSINGENLEMAAASLAGVVARPDSTRVLMALAEVADSEPTVRATFLRLQAGIAERAGRLVGAWAPSVDPDRFYILHALSVGLAVVGLATGEHDDARAKRVLSVALKLLFEKTT